LYTKLYNESMTPKPKNDKPYRPYMGAAYKRIALRIAKKINETSLVNFDDLDTIRHALYELWKRAYPGEPFPADADNLRKRYDKDLEIVQTS